MRRGYLMSICRRMPITRQPYFLPTQISNCSLWLDGADSSSFTLSGSAVTQWNDKSGNGGNATQSTSGNRPTFTGSGAIFNAASNQHFNLNTTFSSTHSIFIVATPTSASQVYLFGRTYPSGHPTFIINYTGSSLEYYPGGDGSTRTTFASPTSTFIAGYVRNFGTSVFGRYNGNQVTISAAPTSEGSSLAWGSLGCSAPIYGNFYTGTIYEFMIFNTVLTTTQCQTIESYLAQKWGLTGSLPAGHPGLNKIIHRNLQTTFSKKQYFTAFSPRNIPGCSLWLDAADSTTITIQTGVSQWNDKSGQGRHVTQSTTSLQPVYSSVSNALVFNSNAWLSIPNALAAITPTYTIFVVDKRASASVHFFIGMHTNTGANVALVLGYNGTTTSHHTTAHITDCMVTIPAYAGTAEPKRLARYDYTGSLRDTYINGGQLSTIQSFSATLPTWNNANVGAGYYIAGTSGLDWWYVGNIHEIIFYNNVLSIGQAQQVESYLAQKWGLVPSIPAGHLNATFPAGSPTAIQAFVPSIKTSLTNIAKAIGGIITNVGSRRFHTFINNGIFSIIFAMPGKIFEVFAIGGGGGGGGFQGGGGGGGGLVTYTSSLSVGNYSITIGTGGIGGTASSVAGGNGTSTLFSSLVTAIGGGGGGSSFGGSPSNGGCGGGGAYNQSYGTGSQGFNGTVSSPSLFWGGGGGGTSASATNNNGGAGTLYYGNNYGGGGGGGGNQGPNGTGGIGGGGDGGGSGSPSAQYITPAPIAGAANTGGGGGGHGYNGTTGAICGTGICIVSYIYP